MKDQKNNQNPIDEVIEMMLKKDAKSCKLASARLSQIEESAKTSFGGADESSDKSAKTSFGGADESLTRNSKNEKKDK